MVWRVFIRFRAKLGDKNKKNKEQRFIANGCPPNFTLLITEKKPNMSKERFKSTLSRGSYS